MGGAQSSAPSYYSILADKIDKKGQVTPISVDTVKTLSCLHAFQFTDGSFLFVPHHKKEKLRGQDPNWEPVDSYDAVDVILEVRGGRMQKLKNAYLVQFSDKEHAERDFESDEDEEEIRVERKYTVEEPVQSIALGGNQRYKDGPISRRNRLLMVSMGLA